ncbi:peptidase M20 domain-containing protein 2-like [Dermacentor albipictus]|uniref:peptidase M20 domain-containing protein 2-like n=1 Tax=Dermacentor albipictus TaxID=60249 RepID=UPI0031FC0019
MWLPDPVRDELRQLSEDIWSCPEPSGDEQFAQQRLTDMLRSRDFFVMPGYLLPTAFCAELMFTEDSGPTICLVCEYDAVRGLGHAWGHNLASTASMAAALAVQMEAAQPPPGATPFRGRLRVLGTPSELHGEGKAVLLNKNAFANVDAVLATRPAFGPGMLYYGTPCATFTRVTYHGRESSAVLCPWQGINAQDAAVAAYRNVTLLRRDLPPHWHVAGVLRPSESQSPLRVPERCQLELFACTPTGPDLLELQKRLRSACMGPCHSTGCMVSFDYQRPYVDMMANEALGQLFLEQAQHTGVSARLFGGASAQPQQQQQQCLLPSGLGAVSHSVPTLCPLFSLDAEPPLMGAAACCTDDAFDRCLQAGRCLALTTFALLRDPALVRGP